MNKDILNCPVCGQPYEVETGKRGRPQVYCSADCKQYASLLSWFEDKTSTIHFTAERRRRVRGDLWRIANCLNK